MIQGSRIKFGITSDLSGLSQGIIVNGIQKNNTTESAQARDQLGNVIDIAAFSDDKNVTIDGMYVSQSLKPGTIINIDNQNYMVTSTGREELNTAFQTASINARLFPGGVVPPTPPEPIVPNPSLMFKGVDDQGSYIQLNQYGSPNAVQLVYRKNNSEWITYNIGDIIALNRNDVVFLSGANDHFSTHGYSFYYFTIDGKTEASGNIMSLMNFSDSCINNCFVDLFKECDDLLTAPQLPATALADYCYASMFNNCTNLTAAPTLSASTLAKSCYAGMFTGCSSLSTAPDLPATTLADSCYQQMFNNCTNLTAAPELPATTLAQLCYDSMFSGCINLSTAPELPATTLAESCYSFMFDGCSSLFVAPDLPATTLTSHCYMQMFANCNQLSSINVSFTDWIFGSGTTEWMRNVAPTGIFYKPSALFEDYHISFIPPGWQVVNKDQPLTFKAVDGQSNIKLYSNDSGTPQHDLVSLKYSKNGGEWTDYTLDQIITLNENDTVSFSGANNYFSENDWNNNSRFYRFAMTGITEADGNIMSLMNYSNSCTDFCFDGLFDQCTSLIKAPQLPATTLAPYCYDGMFSYCSNLSSVSKDLLPSMNLAHNCYRYMFAHCTSLTAGPDLPATTLCGTCYYEMFDGCSSLKVAPQLPATEVVQYCYWRMFANCSSLTDAPALPASTLAKECYHMMFSWCTSLSSIEVNFTEWNLDDLTTNGWVSHVAANGTFTKPASLSTEYGVNYIPSGWTVIDK